MSYEMQYKLLRENAKFVTIVDYFSVLQYN